MSAETLLIAPGDTAYRVWLGHTRTCAGCRAGKACATASKLGRLWREARQSIAPADHRAAAPGGLGRRADR